MAEQSISEREFDFVEPLYVIGATVAAKFVQIARQRAGIVHPDVRAALRESHLMPPDTATFYHLATTLKRRGVLHMSLRRVRLDGNTSAFFVLDGDEVIEVVTFRGIRQIRKLWEHSSKAHIGGGDPKERMREAYKFAVGAQRVGSGLMNQNSGPRSRWK